MLAPSRVAPPVCTDCGVLPYICGSCGDYQCGCPNPYQLAIAKAANKKPKWIPRVHYNREGFPYPAQFIDGYEFEEYPSDEEDEKWLIEGEFRPQPKGRLP